MTRVKALLRHWLDTPSRAEVMPKIREVRVVVTALASERAACHDPSASLPAMNEAMAHATKVCRLYMACAPLEDRPAPVEPAPLDRGEHTARVVLLLYAAALALGLAALLIGCTIRGGACESDDACAPAEVCTRGRCRPPLPQEPPPLPPGAMCVPAMGGPI